MKLKPADTWFSRCVRLAANWRCEKCGKQFTEGQTQGLDCSHIFGRRYRSVRWAKENAQALCMTCHRWYHENPTESGRWVVDFLGQGAYDLLVEKKNQVVKVSKVEEKEIAAHYKKEYNRMVETGRREFTSWQ